MGADELLDRGSFPGGDPSDEGSVAVGHGAHSCRSAMAPPTRPRLRIHMTRPVSGDQKGADDRGHAGVSERRVRDDELSINAGPTAGPATGFCFTVSSVSSATIMRWAPLTRHVPSAT